LVFHFEGREEPRLRVFENRLLKKIFEPKREKVTGDGEDYITRSFMVYTPYQILCVCDQIKKNAISGA
jgi:hypothetical protein